MRNLYLFVIAMLFAVVSPSAGFAQQVRAPKAKTVERAFAESPTSGRLIKASKAQPAFAPLKTDGGTAIYGVLVYRDSWNSITNYDDVPFGVYSFSATSPSPATACATSSNYGFATAGTFLDGKYYLFVGERDQSGTYTGATIYTYNASTWKLESSSTAGLGSIGFQLATDVTTGDIYGIFFNSNATGYVFGKFNPATKSVTSLGDADYYYSLAADADGTIYGINQDAELVRFDKTNGKPTVIGSTGINVSFSLQSGTIDPQSGIYYWAARTEDQGSVLLSINKSTGAATRVGSFTDNEEYAGLAVPAQKASDDAPARPNGITVTAEGASLTGSATFTVPSKTFGGGTLTGSLKATILVDGTAAGTYNVTAGQTATLPVTVKTEGLHTVSVYVSNDAGNSPQASTTYYFGTDVPAQVVEPTLTNNNGTAEVTWDAPETSLHGGYFDASATTYNVIRNIGDTHTTVATGLTDTEYDEKPSVKGIQTVSYTIVAYNGSREGGSSTTNKATFGTSFTPDVTWMLDDDDEWNLFSIIDANKDGYTWHKGTWGASQSYTQNHTTYAESGWNMKWTTVPNADDWFVTPKVHLVPGRLYYFNFSIANTMETIKETFEVKLGKDTTVAALNQLVKGSTTIGPSDNWYQMHLPLQVSEEGDYNIGIHDISKSGEYFKMYVDTLSVTAGPTFTAPDSVLALTLKPAAKGELKSTLTFTAPSKTVGGNALNAIDHIEVYRYCSRDTTLAASISARPGEKLTWTDTNPANGYNTYKVAAYNQSGKGIELERKSWVGIDAPTQVDTVIYKVEGDVAMLSWPKVDTLGQHGGYVDPDNILYSIFDGISYVYYDRACTDTTFALPNNPWEGAQKREFYGIIPANNTGRGTVVFSDWYLVGEPYQLPFVETFTNGRQDNRYWFNGDNNYISGTFRLGVDQKGNGMMMYQAYGAGGMRGIYPGYIDISGANKPVLKFDYACETKGAAGDSIVVKISPVGNSQNQTPVLTVKKETEVGFHTYSVDLSQFKGSRGLLVYFEGHGSALNIPQYIDNIRVADDYANNLTVRGVSTVTEVPYNKTADVIATVANYGENAATGFKVSLYRDGKTLVTQQDGGTLASGEQKDYTLTFTPSISDPDSVDLHVEISWDDDENPSDDASNTFKIAVKKPDIPVVDDLKATPTETGVNLSWTRPALIDGTPARTVTDGFENYADFLISDYGEWTTVDRDGKRTYGIQNVSYPNNFGPAAFQIFNPGAVGISTDPSSNLAPHAGNKYAIAFSPMSGDGADDWLISPLLSGDAQTITFWERDMSSSYRESFEVLYSTTDTQPASFTAVESKRGTANWGEVTFNVPAGAKYFAIHYNSGDGYAMLVDDVTYIEAAHPSKLHFLGYNVYQNGAKVNNAPVAETTYSIDNVKDAAFYVTTVFSEVESAPSNIVTIGTMGINTITVDGTNDGPTYDIIGRRINKTTNHQVYIRNGKKFISK